MSLGLGEITTHANGLISVGDLGAARDLLSTALAAADPRPALACPELAEAAGLLARVMIAQGDAPAARAWAAFAYSACCRLHGTSDERAVAAAATLAAVLHRVGSHARAAHLYREVIDELCAIDGPESQRVLAAHADLATVEYARGQCDVARDRLTDAWELHREVYGDGHPGSIKMLARLGAMHRDCGLIGPADTSLALARDLCRTHLPVDHPLVAQIVALAEAPASTSHRCGGSSAANLAGPDGPDGSSDPGSAAPTRGGLPEQRASTERPAGWAAIKLGPAPASDPAENGAAARHWAEASWVDPDPPATELADPHWAGTLWTDPGRVTPSTDDNPEGPADTADQPWERPGWPGPAATELDTGEPWTEPGWIEKEPVPIDDDEPPWSPSGWLTDDDSRPDQPGDHPPEANRVAIPPPRLPVDLAPTGLEGADDEAGSRNPTGPHRHGDPAAGPEETWPFDEPWWPPELALPEPEESGTDDIDPTTEGRTSPFGPAQRRSSDPPLTSTPPPGIPPVPPNLPVFVPAPRGPLRFHDTADRAAPDRRPADPAHAPLAPVDQTPDRPTPGALSHLPSRELALPRDRRRNLPARRPGGHLPVLVRRPDAAPRRRAPMVVTWVVVVLLSAAAVVAGVTLVDDRSPEPWGRDGPAPATGAPSTYLTVTSTGSASAPAPPGSPPAEVGLRDNHDSVTLTWIYPVGGKGPVLISGGRADQESRAFMELPAGSTSYVAYGLDHETDYCFTVAVVYSIETVGRADPVCTDRAAAPGR